MEESVPVVDFSAYSLGRESPDPEHFQKLIDDVHQALTTIGFMYLKTFGIPAEMISDAFTTSKRFFQLPLNEKMKCAGPEGSFYGYHHMEKEGLNPRRASNDLKEVFGCIPIEGTSTVFPEEELPEFRKCLTDLFHSAILLEYRVLEIIARGLKLDDPFYFTDRHKLTGTNGNMTSIRSLYYPSLVNVDIKEDQVRCGEHCDYGGITLLFQDTQPGLEVKNVHGKWIPASPIEGTLMVNVGELMQRWTSDKVVATEHRVLVPSDQIEHERQSIAIFGNPDNEVSIECIDGSNKYQPTTIIDMLNMKFEQTFGYNPAKEEPGSS
nr:uncharacterized protein LOC129282515 [Lytechinus pictus]